MVYTFLFLQPYTYCVIGMEGVTCFLVFDSLEYMSWKRIHVLRIALHKDYILVKKIKKIVSILSWLRKYITVTHRDFQIAQWYNWYNYRSISRMCNSGLSCFKDKALYKYCILLWYLSRWITWYSALFHPMLRHIVIHRGP